MQDDPAEGGTICKIVNSDSDIVPTYESGAAFRIASPEIDAAVGVDRLAGDVAYPGAGEKAHERGNVFGRPAAADGPLQAPSERASAIARPMLRVLPVTRATRPSSSPVALMPRPSDQIPAACCRYTFYWLTIVTDYK